MRFKNIYCEITNICNLNCSFCKKTARTLQFISVENFRIMINKIKTFTNQICLHILGEPLLHPNFYELVDICRQNNLKINLVTNGTLIEKLSHECDLKKVSFSLHSFPIEKYADNYTEELNNYLTKICTFAEKFKGIVELRLWNKDNDNGLNENILNFLANFYECEMPLITHKIKENHFLGVNSPFVWPSLSERICSGSYCYGLRHQIGILVDGTIVPCCLDGEGVIKLGNIYNDSLQEVIDSPTAQEMLEGFRKRKPTQELCKHCQFIERFNL